MICLFMDGMGESFGFVRFGEVYLNGTDMVFEGIIPLVLRSRSDRI